MKPQTKTGILLLLLSLLSADLFSQNYPIQKYKDQSDLLSHQKAMKSTLANANAALVPAVEKLDSLKENDPEHAALTQDEVVFTTSNDLANTLLQGHQQDVANKKTPIIFSDSKGNMYRADWKEGSYTIIILKVGSEKLQNQLGDLGGQRNKVVNDLAKSWNEYYRFRESTNKGYS
jgi:hypothetical protein